MSSAETCVCCGATIPEGRQYCVICGYKAEKKMTNYDRIRNMSVEGLAVLLDKCDTCLPPYCRSKKANECDNNCLECAKQWLESEVTE